MAHQHEHCVVTMVRGALLAVGIASMYVQVYSNALSKIEINSQVAHCTRDDEKHKIFFTYEKKVDVTLADKSTIKSDKLEIILNDTNSLKSTTTHQGIKVSNKQKVEMIQFSNNVRIAKGHRFARADRMLIKPSLNECHLYGNVIIRQERRKKKDIPIVTKGDHAILNLKTHHITLLGNTDQPVNTTIVLSKREKKS